MINISEEEYETLATTRVEVGGPVAKLSMLPARRTYLEEISLESWEGVKSLDEGTIIDDVDEVTSYEELVLNGKSIAVKNVAGCFKKRDA